MPIPLPVSADISTFLQAANNAAARAALGVPLTVAATLALSGGSNSTTALAANTSGLITAAGSATHTLTLPAGATNDVVKRRIEWAEGATATVLVQGTDFTFTATGREAIGTFEFSKAASGWVATGENSVNKDTDTTAPTVSTLSPAVGATGIAAGANLVITFSEPVVAGTGNITIVATAGPTNFEVIPVGDGRVAISGATVTINPSGTLANNTAYHVLIDATAFDDAAGNSFAGIASAATWNFTTVAAGLPSGAAVVLDARLLSYANNTPIDNGSNKWTDTSGNSNHAVQATGNLQPLVKTSTSESGSARTILFDPATNADNVVLTSAVSLTGVFTLGIKFKAATRDGALLTNAGVSAYVAGIVAQNGEISATSDGDAVDSASVVTGGKYHAAPSGVFYNDGVAGNATFTTTINGSGAINSVTIGGTNTGYDGTVTAVITQLGAAQFQTGTQKSTAMSADLADGSFHNLVITRNASNLVTFELDGSALGTATYSGTLSAGQIGTYLDGNIEALVIYASDQTANLAAIRTWLG